MIKEVPAKVLWKSQSEHKIHQKFSAKKSITQWHHTRKWFKALINSGTTISLIHMSVYNMIDDHYETSILPTVIHLMAADGSHMSLRGKTTLHLQIANFKFSHTFICDRLLETDFIFGIDLQKGILHLIFGTLHTERRLTPDLHQKHNIAVVKSTLKILPRHNDIVPIRISGTQIKDLVAYYFSNPHQEGTQPKHPCKWWHLQH